jgi:hypothetical protein
MPHILRATRLKTRTTSSLFSDSSDQPGTVSQPRRNSPAATTSKPADEKKSESRPFPQPTSSNRAGATSLATKTAN